MIDFKLSLRKKIYLSYIPQETLIADEMTSYLEECGYQVIGTPYQEKSRHLDRICEKLIYHADIVVALTSPSASRSDRLWADIGQARIHNVPVIPFVTHEFGVFDEKVPMKHFINASDDLHDGCERLQAALKRVRGYKTNDLHPQPRLRDLRRVAISAAIMVLTIISGLLN